MGIGPICDAKYSMLFNDESVTIISPTGICLERLVGRYRQSAMAHVIIAKRRESDYSGGFSRGHYDNPKGR